LNFAESNCFAFVSLTAVGFGNLIPMTAPASMSCVLIAVARSFDIEAVMGVPISELTIEKTAQARADPHKPD
jgi:hypothetical protein